MLRRHLYIRDMVENMELRVPLVSTVNNFADFFTKLAVIRDGEHEYDEPGEDCHQDHPIRQRRRFAARDVLLVLVAVAEERVAVVVGDAMSSAGYAAPHAVPDVLHEMIELSHAVRRPLKDRLRDELARKALGALPQVIRTFGSGRDGDEDRTAAQ